MHFVCVDDDEIESVSAIGGQWLRLVPETEVGEAFKAGFKSSASHLYGRAVDKQADEAWQHYKTEKEKQ